MTHAEGREDPAELHGGSAQWAVKRGGRQGPSGQSSRVGRVGRKVRGLCHGPPLLWCPKAAGEEGTAERPPFCPGKKAPSPPLFLSAPSVPPPPSQELPRFSYFILQCPIQKSFQRPQPCQSGARTKGLFDFLFVFICQWRGRGQERKSCWVLKFLFGLLHSQRGRLPGTPF